MSEPIVFISHFRVKEGKLDGFERYYREGAKLLQAEKPQTLVFLAYLNGDGSRVSIAHAFADVQSMDLHVQGAEERSREAYEFVEPQGFEIYGTPSVAVMEMFRQAAKSEGETRFQPRYLDGFLRLRSAASRGRA